MSGSDALLWALTGPIGPAIKKMSGGYDKPPKAPAMLPDQSQAPSLLEDTKLKPGEKVNLINTSPQGVLSGDTASTGRNKLLGG